MIRKNSAPKAVSKLRGQKSSSGTLISSPSQTLRSVDRVLPAHPTLEGEGFLVHRPFPAPGMLHLDPFLMLDEMGPAVLPPGEAKGAPNHPHRGFETVTYLLEGEAEHHDSQGNHGVLRPGDVQWMTAGRGVIHSEMPSEKFQREGGRMHGFQLWVNLPRVDKMMKARYQEIPSKKIPEVVLAGGLARAKVIAGAVGDGVSVIETRVPIQYVDFDLQEGAEIRQPAPQNHTAFAYVYEGQGSFGADAAGQELRVERGHLVLFAHDGDLISARATGPEGLRFLLLSGQPIGEPIAQFGPFVMNTQAELEQAFWDFQSGHFL